MFTSLFGQHHWDETQTEIIDKVKLEVGAFAGILFFQVIVTTIAYVWSLRNIKVVHSFQFVMMATQTIGWLFSVFYLFEGKGFTVNFNFGMNAYVCLIAFSGAKMNTGHYCWMMVVRDIWAIVMFSSNQVMRVVLKDEQNIGSSLMFNQLSTVLAIFGTLDLAHYLFQ